MFHFGRNFRSASAFLRFVEDANRNFSQFLAAIDKIGNGLKSINRIFKFLDLSIKNFSRLMHLGGALLMFGKWFVGFFKNKDKELSAHYTMKMIYKKQERELVTAIVTSNPLRVNQWWKDQFLEEEFQRPGAITIFTPPVSENLFMVVFLAKNDCIIFRFAKDWDFSDDLRGFIENPSFHFYIDSENEIELKKLMNRSVKGWEIPEHVDNLTNLACKSTDLEHSKLVNCNSFELAHIFLKKFGYRVPMKVYASDWDTEILSDEQLEFLCVMVYSTYLVADSLGGFTHQ